MIIYFIGLPTIPFNISRFSTVVVFYRFLFFKLFSEYLFFKLFLGCVKFHRVVALIKIIIVRFFYLEKFSWFWSVVNFFWVFFNPLFVELIIQFNYYFIENIQLVILSPVPHKLIFDVFLQTFFEYIYQYNIILFGIIGLSLKFCNIFCCRFRLSYFLNLLFHDSVFVGDIKNSANFFLEGLPVFKKYFDIDVAEVLQIYWYFGLNPIPYSSTEISNSEYYFVNSFYFVFFEGEI